MISFSTEAMGQDLEYIKCFDRGQTNRLVLELKERDSYFEENRMLSLQVSALRLQVADLSLLKEKNLELQEMTRDIIVQNEALRDEIKKSKNRLCSSSKCRTTIAALSAVIGGSILYLILKE